MITLTDAARQHFLQVMTKNNHHYLKFGLQGGGCAGFEYYWEPVAQMLPDQNDHVMNLDLTHYLVIDAASQMHVLGSTIDYVSDMFNSQVKVINPLAKSSCGCGTSISL
jgi:iron-sulfur cluster insertion protein